MVFGISSRFQLLSQSPGQVSHVLRTRSPLSLPEQAPWTSFDLHVLSTPPAFILSQDQTLQQKRGRLLGNECQMSTSPDGMSVCVKRPAVFLLVTRVRDRASSCTPTNDRYPCCCRRDADSEIDRQSLAAPRGVPTGLPALAFCLLFRFQGAEARNALYAGQLPVRGVDSCAFPVAIASVKRVAKLTQPKRRRNLRQEIISRRWWCFLPRRSSRYFPWSSFWPLSWSFAVSLTPLTE